MWILIHKHTCKHINWFHKHINAPLFLTNQPHSLVCVLDFYQQQQQHCNARTLLAFKQTNQQMDVRIKRPNERARFQLAALPPQHLPSTLCVGCVCCQRPLIPLLLLPLNLLSFRIMHSSFPFLFAMIPFLWWLHHSPS